ncbi:antirestriction protein ArdA [Rhodoferax mekongensis]|uniref:Antirestriction protein ArdA n=1 Tax=Rhodoferax mekongensis TaxID=3068341 RepID=A0ABZ0B2J7_9BURK|nr:antirestriction protein ArdA [Rhodoferax sp. TBRC 17307]WNO06012.1 antirestriction protein ArdA [Rhodoferax sp. TBRC 17307]
MSQAFWYVDGEPTKGKWIDMDLIDSTDEVLEELAEAGFIPRDEDGGPEYGGDLLVADAEDLAKAFLGRHGTFDLDDFVEARDHCSRNHVDEDAVVAYISMAGSWSKSDFEESYVGAYDNEQSYAEEYCDECMEVPEALQGYIDYEKLARDLFINDVYYSDGYVFRRI